MSTRGQRSATSATSSYTPKASGPRAGFLCPPVGLAETQRKQRSPSRTLPHGFVHEEHTFAPFSYGPMSCVEKNLGLLHDSLLDSLAEVVNKSHRDCKVRS